MKSEMKAIVASIVVIALALGAFSGVTYSWFSATEKADIDVTAGVVDIELSDMTLKTYSWNGGTYEFQNMAKVGETAGFLNSPDGKGASLTQNSDGSWIIVVDGISDKDYVEIIGDITNKSTINTIYRTTLECTDGSEDFFNALVSGTPTHTSWAPVAAASDPTVGDKIVEDGLLSKIGLDGYSTGTGATCKIEFAVEAYQANADVDKTVDQLTVKGENTVTIKSIDPSSKLKEATIVFDDPTGGKKVAASEVAVSDSSTYGIPGIVSAGIGLTSVGATDLYKGCNAIITMVLDGVYTREQIDVYHGSNPLPSTTGSKTNEITVSSDPSSNTTTVTIVTYDGFSPYFITQKTLKATSSSSISYHYSLDAALAVSPTEIEILYDYDGNSKAVMITNPVNIYGSDGVTVTDVNFTINIVDKDATVSISNLRMETHSSSQAVEHIVSLKNTNQCRVELDRVEFITGCTYNDRTKAAVWAEVGASGSLIVDGCTFSLGSDISKDVKRHALELNTLSSVSITGCMFNDISRPVNLDGVQIITASNNVFNMPTGSKDTNLEGLLKVYSINKDIESFSTSGDTINWMHADGIMEAPVFINSDVKAESFASDKEVYIKDGKTFSTGKVTTLSLVGEGKNAVFNMENKAITAESISFRNLTYKSGTNDYCGIQHSTSVTFTDCTITGKSFLYADKVTFKNCTFKQENADYNIWTYGAKDVSFTGCTFECKGKSILIYNEGDSSRDIQTITFNKCKFKAELKAEGKAAIEVDSALLKEGMNFTVNINDCTQTGFDNGSVSGNPLWNEKKHDTTLGTHSSIYVDGKLVWSGGKTRFQLSSNPIEYKS